MNIQINAQDFSASEQLTEFIHQKAEKLKKRFENIISLEIFLNLDNKGAQVRDKVAKVKVHIAGHQLVASDTRLNFEDAIEQAMDNVKEQLIKHKEKMRGQ